MAKKKTKKRVQRPAGRVYRVPKFKFKLYKMPYMHIKLTLVVVVIALHGYLKVKAKRVRKGEPMTAPPLYMKPLLSITAIGIILFVIEKWPLPS